MSPTHSSRRAMRRCCLGPLLAVCAVACLGQVAPPPDAAQTQEKLQQLSADLAAAQQRLQDSQKEIQRLQDELAALQAQFPATKSTPASPSVAAAPSTPESTAEKVEILQAEVKQHEQSKVESVSKYPARLTGLLLFNSFVDSGNVDNIDLPSIASPPAAGVGTLTTGASVRQTILGVQVTGPHLFGAQSSAEVNMDFYGGVPYSNYGTVAGIIRLRTAAMRLNWDRDTIEIGFTDPLISPLTPTSYATVAEPSMAWAGNLWTWSPQASYRHRFGSAASPHFAWQAGFWDPPTPGYNADALFRTASTGERSGQPAYETRISFARDARTDGLQLGLGGYYSRQSYTGRNGDSWAATADWRVPMSRFFELAGEAYRGRAIGGLGGGVYKDVVTGNDPHTGLPALRLLNAAGGWTQAKLRFTPTIEANAAIGLDDGFAGDFHALVLVPGSSNTLLRARNRMAVANLIFSPKTYLILSPEYRRIWTWPIHSARSTADIFTLTFGLRF
ncbi:MAG TPA: hypothetical protein VIJ79_07060 [Acidobacteriaceae bacterium]